MSDNKIDEILKEVSSLEIYEFKELHEFKNDQSEYNSYRRLLKIRMVTELNLLTLLASNKAILSERGKRISENGGWLKYLADEKKKSERTKRKDNWDYYYSKYRYFTYPLIFITSLIGCGLGIANFIKSQSNEENKANLETPIQQTEAEESKLRISSSIPQISDSLQTPNQENNSLQIEPLKDSL